MIHGSKLLLLNARSITNKLNELEFLLTSHPDQIVCVTESWLDETVPNSVIIRNTDNICFRCDRVGKKGGGVMVLIPKKFKSFEIASTSNESFEGIMLSVFINSINFTLVNVYRPPGNDPQFMPKFENFLQPVLAKPECLILMGDFNLPDINWTTLTTDVSNQNINYQFLEFSLLNALHQAVHFSTREENLLDLCLTSDTIFISHVECLAPFASSDHNQIRVHLNLSSFEKQCGNFRNFGKADYEGMKRYFGTVCWPEIFNPCVCTEDFYAVFRNIFNSAIEKFVPFTPRGNSFKKRWPKSVIDLQKRKLMAYQLYKRTRIRVNYLQYRNLDKQIQREQREVQLAHERTLIANRSDKKFWNFVSSKFGCKQDIPPLKTANGEVLLSDKERAECFSEFFETMYTADNGEDPPLVQRASATELNTIVFRSEIVYAELCSLPNKFSYGPDGFPAILLKKLAFELAEPLSTIFEISFRLGTLPKIWLQATVTPVFKKGNRTDVKNYRPISLTCVPCKVMEAIVRDKITNFLSASGIVSPNQHGFMARRSTVTQLLSCLNHWSDALDNGKCIDVAYLDFASAFTSVSLTKLTNILHQIGLRDPLLQWVNCFLSGRLQSVRVDSCLSEAKEVSSGVPQGTLLGPLLFLIYINGIDSVIERSTIAIYADDCKVFSSFDKNEPRAALQNDLTNISTWSNSMQLNLSLPKCTVLHIGPRNRGIDFEYSLGDVVLDSVPHIKDLGITVTSDLKFSAHCLTIARKASQKASCIIRFFETKDPLFLFQMFCVYCRPILEYASPAWNPHLKKDVVLLERVQRNFTKRIFRNQNLSYEERLNRLKTKSLAERRIEIDLIMTYKIINGLVDLNTSDFFTLSQLSNTRGHPLKLHKPRLQKSVSARYNFFSNRIINVWNELPEDVVLSASLPIFKQKICKHDFSDLVNYS